MELCELVSKERDPQKLRALLADITDFLDAEDQRRKSAAAKVDTEAETAKPAPATPEKPATRKT
jgi:hypothetical protein